MTGEAPGRSAGRVSTSRWELALAGQLRVLGVPEARREFVFHPVRMWRFDFAWPAAWLAVEFEGGVFSRKPGRHNRGSGFIADLVKYNQAQLGGWVVLRYTDRDVKSWAAAEEIRRALVARGIEMAPGARR